MGGAGCVSLSLMLSLFNRLVHVGLPGLDLLHFTLLWILSTDLFAGWSLCQASWMTLSHLGRTSSSTSWASRRRGFPSILDSIDTHSSLSWNRPRCLHGEIQDSPWSVKLLSRRIRNLCVDNTIRVCLHGKFVAWPKYLSCNPVLHHQLEGMNKVSSRWDPHLMPTTGRNSVQP
jgi:hypothetical protein